MRKQVINYEKRTQKDGSLSLKLQIGQEKNKYSASKTMASGSFFSSF